MHRHIALVLFLSACAGVVDEDGASESIDAIPDDVELDLVRVPAEQGLFPPLSGWTYNLYRDVTVKIRSSCLYPGCAESNLRELKEPAAAGAQITGDASGYRSAQFKWKNYANELNPRTGAPYPAWVPIWPEFAVDFRWGCADTPGGGPVNDYAPCHGGPKQRWHSLGVASTGAPFNTSGVVIDGNGSYPCWDLPAISIPALKVHTCHSGPTQQFQFDYTVCSAKNDLCEIDLDCCSYPEGSCSSVGRCTQ